MAEKLNVAILGATGAVGQRFIQLLDNHPWFKVAEVIGSERSAGKKYIDAANWVLDAQPPADVAELTVRALHDDLSSPLVFSALPKEAAVEVEMKLAGEGYIVCTNASTNRMVEDVPLLLPEVNHEHLSLIDVQRANRGWTTGALVANSNCTTMPVVMSLKPLLQFGVDSIHMTSMQAISGAGYPGVASLDILDNVVPYVGSDEEKMQTETLRMLGDVENDVISWLSAKTSASCNRVPVVDGHLVSISIELQNNPGAEAIIDAWDNYPAPDDIRMLPSAPEVPVQYLRQIDRPQIRRDRNAGNGMTTSIGRLRVCDVLDYKFTTLSHNTIRGAAGCSILNAELMAVRGYIADFKPAIAQAVAQP
ncbi:MAG: aspartate-semialdehyde dehydrogenase [Chloroflexota bacterium]